MRGSAFHWSSSSRSRLAPLRQSVPSASFSASATMPLLVDLAPRPRFCARSALRASRWLADHRAERVEPAGSAARSPTALASVDLAAHGLDRLGRPPRATARRT